MKLRFKKNFLRKKQKVILNSINDMPKDLYGDTEFSDLNLNRKLWM